MNRPPDAQTPWVIVGCGRVGSALALFAQHIGVEVRTVWDRSREPAVGATHQLTGPIESLAPHVAGAAVFLTVSDDALAEVATRMAAFSDDAALVVHCSGSLASTLLSECGITAPVASVHPLLAIAQPAEAVAQFGEAAWTIEGHPSGLSWARAWLSLVGVEPVTIAAERKILYHAAAVTSAGLVVALMDVAFEMAETAGLTPSEARRMLLPLAHSSLNNLTSLPPSQALTGPVARGDEVTITQHLAAMVDVEPSALEIYRALTARSRQVVKRGRDD